MSKTVKTRIVYDKIDDLFEKELNKLMQHTNSSDQLFFVIAKPYGFNKSEIPILREILIKMKEGNVDGSEETQKLKKNGSELRQIVNDKIDALSGGDINILMNALEYGYQNMCSTSKDFGFTTNEDPILRNVLIQMKNQGYGEAPKPPSETELTTKANGCANTTTNNSGECCKDCIESINYVIFCKFCFDILDPKIANADEKSYWEYVCCFTKCAQSIGNGMGRCSRKMGNGFCGNIMFLILALIFYILLIISYVCQYMYPKYMLNISKNPNVSNIL